MIMVASGRADFFLSVNHVAIGTGMYTALRCCAEEEGALQLQETKRNKSVLKIKLTDRDG